MIGRGTCRLFIWSSLGFIIPVKFVSHVSIFSLGFMPFSWNNLTLFVIAVPSPKIFAHLYPFQLHLDVCTILWLNCFLSNLQNAMSTQAQVAPEPDYADVRIEILMPKVLLPDLLTSRVTFRCLIDAVCFRLCLKTRSTTLHRRNGHNLYIFMFQVSSFCLIAM